MPEIEVSFCLLDDFSSYFVPFPSLQSLLSHPKVLFLLSVLDAGSGWRVLQLEADSPPTTALPSPKGILVADLVAILEAAGAGIPWVICSVAGVGY